MAKLLFAPVSIASGFVAAALAGRVFEHIWALVDDQEPPEATHRDAEWSKLLLSAALQGAVFRMVRTATDRGSRQAFESVTGAWPGEREPDPEP